MNVRSARPTRTLGYPQPPRGFGCRSWVRHHPIGRFQVAFIILVLFLAAGCGPAPSAAAGAGPGTVSVANTPTALPTSTPDPTLSATPTSTPVPSVTPAATLEVAHFVIRGEESQASYIARVQPFNQQAQASVVGSTSAIAGDVFLYPLTWMIVPDSVSQITVNLTTLESDEPQRDTALRDHYLESSRFPEAVYLLRKVSPADPSEARTTVAPGGGLTANVPIKLEGDLTIRETTRPVTWVGTATLEGDRLTGTVSTTIALGDYGIPAIKLAFLEVEASVTVELQLAADRVTAG